MEKINGLILKEMYDSGSNALLNNSARIDSMNVFPVPDGDTGSNMSSTSEYANNELKNIATTEIGTVASAFSKGMLMGARGNSGVILSQIFKGISNGLKGKKEATAKDLVTAFEEASTAAYKSVMSPIEGTILTVIRETSEDISAMKDEIKNVIDFFEKVSVAARKSCDHTPELLPVLKEVGVVDSGGEGLCIFFDGMLSALKGKPVEIGPQVQRNKETQMMMEHSEGEFGYCTEFIVDLKNPKNFKEEKFKEKVIDQGGSIVLVRDENILKIHIHTYEPGKTLTLAQKHGEFIKIKIENMTLQANNSHSLEESSFDEDGMIKPNAGEVVLIACNSGKGIIEKMREFGTNFIIEAGQTMNPSAKDFVEAIEKLQAEKIIILPNNSNIILAAQQVAQTSDKEILVIPTKTQMQGITAAMNFDPTASLEDNRANIEEAIGFVKTGQVTIAGKTTKIKGVSVKEGEYLAIAEREIIKSVPSKVEAAIAISNDLIDDETEIVTIFYGQGSTLTDANELASYLETHFDVEIEIHAGHQSVYDFLIAYE